MYFCLVYIDSLTFVNEDVPDASQYKVAVGGGAGVDRHHELLGFLVEVGAVFVLPVSREAPRQEAADEAELQLVVG
jgi:hypothetical protein